MCFRKELLTISAAVMGIEFAYAAETAFVSPTLLKIGEKWESFTETILCTPIKSQSDCFGPGVSQTHMTLIWCLSPLVGFFLTPILGSLSDRYCLFISSSLLRRREKPVLALREYGTFTIARNHYSPICPAKCKSLLFDVDDWITYAQYFALINLNLHSQFCDWVSFSLLLILLGSGWRIQFSGDY